MNGIIIINKPKGYTSHDVVNKLRKILNMKKIGHTGTLDPNATGVLPVLLGNATKISKYLIEHDKTYIATIKLGQRTETLDSEGEVVQEQEVDKKIITEENIQKVLNTFLGKQEQLPPMYSAVKINGKKLYDYAKEGQDVERKAREIEIYDIKITGINKEENELSFEVSCSKGTYIRVLCEDIAKRLNTIGYMKELVRTQVNDFVLKNSITLEELEKLKENSDDMPIIAIEEIFESKNRIDINDRKLELFLNGVMLTFDLEDEVYRVYNKDNFIGLGIVNGKLLKRDVVM